MPFDPNLSRDITASPLARLSPDGVWQVSLSHTRRENLLIWITRGHGRICLNGQQRGFSPNTAICIPAGTLWSADFTRQSLGQVLIMTGPLAEPFPNEPIVRRFNTLQDQTYLAAQFEAISREQQATQPDWQRAVQAHADLAAIALARQPEPATASGRPSAAQRLCRAYCRRIADIQAPQSSMASHAEALHVTPTHLTRVCKSETGKTAAALLTEHQLHAARSLLIGSDLAVRDIADQLGFGSAAYFTRFISQHTGLTPSKLRQLARQSAQPSHPQAAALRRLTG